MCFVTVAAGIYPEPFMRLATYSLVLPVRIHWPLRIQPRLPPHRRGNGPPKASRQFSDIMELPILLVASVAIGGGRGIFSGQALPHFAHIYFDSWLCWALPAGMIQLVRRLSKDT